MAASAPSADVSAQASAWPLPVALLGASLLGSAWLGLKAPDPAAPVAALFPPWWNSAETLGAAASAGGTLLGLGGLPGLVVTQSPIPGFADRLRAAGAVLLLDPRGLGPCKPSGMRPS